jgi:hypothetical protein
MKRHFLLAGLASLFVAALPESQAQLPSSFSTFDQRVQVEAIRARRLRTEGGDFDDKMDRITFNVKLTNSDTKATFNDCKAEFYVFAESILNRKAYLLLGVDRSSFSLPPRAVHEFPTQEVATQWDTTGARFGAKYDGWVLVVRDSTDKVIMKKASNPGWLPVADKLNTLKPKLYYGRDLRPITVGVR